MREPIRREDIREGDEVEFEWDGPQPISGRTRMTVIAQCDRQWPTHVSRAYLLNRPEPAVDLPTEPTLGWVTYDTGRHGDTFFAAWNGREYADEVTYNEAGETVHRDIITAFTPAVAVPKAALDELRDSAHRAFFGTNLYPAIETFLAAVEAANGDPR